jgi:transcriptional regulator with XRE-family HTH domain
VAGLSFSDEYAEMLALLRKARKVAGLTQMDVARAFGRTQGFVSKVESGEIRIDPIELQKFAELYGVEVMELLPQRVK